jgi:hypothetical protein
MPKSFPREVTSYFMALLGCAYLSACTTPGTEKAKSTQTLAASPVADASPQVQESKTDRYAKLNSSFLVKLKQVNDPYLRMYYTQGIHYLHRLAQDNSENREILEKLVQHQEQTLDIFQICGSKETFNKDFDWLTLYHSQYWKRADNHYLVLLICSTGTSNRRFVTFLYSENNGKAEFKPLKLAYFKRENGTIQRFDSEMGVGRSFPNTDQWFDPMTKELRIWTRLGGGSEPCGTKGTYQLQNDEFVLKEFTARFDCDPRKKSDYEQLYP